MQTSHISVLLDECINYLNIKPNGIYVDCTFGSGGHSKAIYEKLSDNGLLLSLDYDKNNIVNSNKNNWQIVNGNFADIKIILKKLNIKKIDGVLLDLGYSTDQLNNPDYGLKFKSNYDLNMKINPGAKYDAKFIINNFDKSSLISIFKKYGESNYSSLIAKNIINSRKLNPITTTKQLSDIIIKSVPSKTRRIKHPAKKIFQALRIYINNELEDLKDFLNTPFDYLKKGGRCLIISFNSLEDRIIKQKYNILVGKNIENNKLPIMNKSTIFYKIINKKPIKPTIQEINNNPASRSAKLRILEKV